MNSVPRLLVQSIMAICSLGLGPWASQAIAQTYSPNFSGPALDPTLIPNPQPGFSFSVGGGSLQIHYDYAGGAAQQLSGGVLWDLPFSGDYVARFTVDVSQMPEPSAGEFMNGGPSLNATGAGTAFVGPWRSGTGADVNGASFDPGYASGPVVHLPSQVVDIQVQRVGDTIHESVAPAGTGLFQEIYSVTGTDFAGHSMIYMDLFHSGSAPITNATISYSNVSVRVVPEPSTALALAMGLAVLGLTQRRRSPGGSAH